MATEALQIEGAGYRATGNSTHVATFTNNTSNTVTINFVEIPLGTGTGYFNTPDPMTGTGGSISTYITCAGISSNTVSVNNAVPAHADGYPTYINCINYKFTFTNLTLESGGTLNFYIQEPATQKGETGLVLVVNSYTNSGLNGTIDYTPVPTSVTLYYNANGGGGAPAAQTLVSGVAGTISSTRPTRVNYRFLGWNTSSSATSATYQPGGSITITSDTTLYAIWLKQITITFNSNGGSLTPKSITTDAGKSITLPAKSEVGSRSSTIEFKPNGGSVSPTSKTVNATALNWNTNSAGTGTSYNFGAAFSASSDTTLYVSWQLYVMKPSDWPTPSYTNATFLGWYSDLYGGSKLNGSNYTVQWGLNAYAHWNYNVIYNFNGGSIDINSDEGTIGSPTANITETKLYDSVYTINPKFYPMKSNQYFKGWVSGSTIYQPGNNYTTDAPLLLTASYDRPTYTVIFEDGYSGEVLKSENVLAGNDAKPPEPDPTRTGYTFRGWAGDFENVQSNKVIKALWEFGLIWIYIDGKWINYEPKE